MPPVIDVRLLGPVEIQIDGAPPPSELLRPMNLALFLYLALSGRRTRDQLIGLLWPDKPQSAASRSLAVALSELRRDLGTGVIETQAQQVWMAPGVIHLDLQQLEALPQHPEWRQVHPLIRGAVLQGVASDLSAVEDWLETERRPWNRKAIGVLMRTVSTELCAGRVQEATEAATRALTIDPLSEAAVMALMRALTLGGDRVGALREYDAFATRIFAEFDTQPGTECTTLAECVRSERDRPAAQALQTRLLVGDMGLSKTRLRDEIAARERLDGATILVTRTVESDLRAPWSGMLGLARGGLLDAPGLAAAPAPALAWFAHRIPELADRSVLGDCVLAEMVTRATALPLATALEALDELEWARWLAADGRGYTFVALIVREVVDRDLVLPGQRQRLRAAAGLGTPPAS